MFNISAIVEGWRNHLAPPEEMKAVIEEVSKQRLAICTPCEENSRNRKPNPEGKLGHCKQCHCPLTPKSKALNHACPLGKWEAYLSDKERKELDEQLKELNNGKTDQSQEENS